MYSDFLEKIIKHKESVNREKRGLFAKLKTNLSKSKYSRYKLFKQQISEPGMLNLIAEVKKASPSKGIIREDFNAVEIAKTYKRSGAKAISVLTEDKYFLGKTGYLKDISDEVGLPVLTKDFIIEEGQIYEAAYNGASAVLLIVTLLSEQKLAQFIKIAATLDMDCLVEIHDEDELKIALTAGAEIIGINNRNLKTFAVDMSNSVRLVPKIPEGKVIVAESGIKAHEDIIKLKNLGVHAVLIGETFMRADDIAGKVKEVMGSNMNVGNDRRGKEV